VTLAAAREADRIVITVADDGAGIDGRKLRAAAEARGLLDAAALAAMDEAALAELVFLPGFSTAASVTAISGRGVGMDAVRAAVEALGGTVALRSTPGAGMMVRLSLPQAVLVTTIVTVRVGAQGFGVPIEAVAETARLPAGAIQRVRGGEAFVLRGRTVPLLRLGRLLGLEGTAADEARVLVVRAGEALVGVAVDAVGERIDVLLRPMAGLLAGTRGVQGAALMGDGSVLMVLDLADLIA
jgi:two-component system chemotaxis sensor kinase CheA